MDWADKLIAKKKKRGETFETAETLRNNVQSYCDNNIKREKWNTPKNKEAAHAKEMKRLIKLKQDQDKREEVEYSYKQLGIIVTADYSQYGKISSVQLPFTTEEWTNLLNKEGESLPACCADISRIRDILQEALREDGRIEVEDFFEAYSLAKLHGFTISTPPIGKLISLWEVVKDNVRIRGKSASVDTEDPKDALDLLFTASGTICWQELYSKENVDEGRLFSDHVNRNFSLATIQTAVRTLYFKLKELYNSPVEGYGLVRRDGEIGKTRTGLAVFKSQEIAEEICEKWNKDDGPKRKKKKDHVFHVRKVRITLEKGVEILGDEYEEASISISSPSST